MEVKDKIIRAKVHLQKENPFFSYLIMNLNFIEDKEGKEVQSIGIDFKGNCYYYPDWIEKLSDDELKGVLSHEVLHISLQHLVRLMGRGKELWNISTDLAINYILMINGFKLPTGLVPYGSEFKVNEKFTLKDIDKKVAEEIYNELYRVLPKSKQGGSGLGKGNRGFDIHKYPEGMSSEEKKKIEKEVKKWNRLMSEAGVYAKQQGNLPAGIERLVDLMLDEKVNWKHLLYKYITRELPYDYSYNRPSRRSQAVGVYLPSVLRESIDIVVSVDTSGSIGQEELSEFLNEIINIAKSFNNIKITLIVCDCEIKDVYEVSNGSIESIRNLKIRGGGGTNHKPIYEYIREHIPNTKFVINFTDGYTTFPDDESVRTIWVLTKNSCDEKDILFGEVIKLE